MAEMLMYDRMYKAIASGDVERLRLLLDEGADKDHVFTHSGIIDEAWFFANGDTTLHVACKCGDIGIVELLLQRGAAAHARTERQSTALHIACCGNHPEIAELLLRHGARIEDTDGGGDTALLAACFDGSAGAVELLLSHRVNLEARDRNGKTSLHVACSAAGPEIAELLLSHGADKDAATTTELDTPLHIACDMVRADPYGTFWTGLVNNSSIARQVTVHNAIGRSLLLHGANVDAINAFGETPLHKLAMGDPQKMTEELLLAGAHPDTADRNGCTPLHVACRHKNARAIESLVRHGADVTKPDATGCTPLSAMDSGDREAVMGLIAQLKQAHIRSASALLRGCHARLGVESPASLLGGFSELTKVIVALAMPSNLGIKMPDLP